MQAIYDYLYKPGLPLQTMGIIVGVFLLVTHLFALIKPDLAKDFLSKFPRHEKIGIVLCVIAFAWGLVVWTGMDLGEFYWAERYVQLIIIAVGVGVLVYVREFLAVRSLGFLLILVGAPILDSAFLKDPVSRLLLVALAYAGILLGMFWMGMPYLLRNAISWVLKVPGRFTIGALAGAVYGVVVLVCAIVLWG
ncbi:MAG: hypothetical protein AAF236_15720 [Verrucomicrobiota bacterium]